MSERILNWFFDNIMPTFILMMVAAFGILLIVLCVAAFKESQRTTFELKKDDWSCTKEYEWYSSIKGLRTTHHDCIEWSHK